MRLLITFISIIFTSDLVAAELQLRDEVRTAGPLVLVSHIAEIHARDSAEAAELAAIDLMPAPPASEKRVLRLREVQDLLAVRGVNLAVHRFSGASQVTIHGPKRAPSSDAKKPPRAKAPPKSAKPAEPQVALPPAIVVARHSLPKGTILRADDVKLQSGLPTKGEAEVYQSIEDVVGKETTRSITEGQILDNRIVRRQLLVRRNEIVTLYARAAGVTVRTTARVRDDGAVGDQVTVETLEDRKPLFARVSGPQEVEVFAQAVSATEPNQHATK